MPDAPQWPKNRALTAWPGLIAWFDGIGQDVPRRIWERDHTLWNPDPTEIGNRLGWLTVAGEMRKRVGELQSFAQQVRCEGFTRVVLLGMGGSSLGALALHRLFGSAEGFPRLRVLDTTVPDTISAVTNRLDCENTLFIVASKSGTTIEPNALYRHFRLLVEQAVGRENAGNHFIAICDAGTPLEALASEHRFRRTFTNPPDIGGRYSVQSLFGLVPAALIGVDIDCLLERVEAMSRACGPDVLVQENPGAWLGAALGILAMDGRDKMTVVSTESLCGFSLWVEQLLAESTGKEGRGIVPIIGEPLCHTDTLSDDRMFIYVRLDGDDAAETDTYIERVEAAGIPTVRLNLADKHDIGTEFFRWEFATAVAGNILGIHPFDQPDVQGAKDRTDGLLADYETTLQEPVLNAVSSFAELMSYAKVGDYLAITVYANATSDLESAIARLRRRVMSKWGIATTFGYGPRYLHSTGQLHKGGTDSGLFLQLTQLGNTDVTIPGESFTFGVLAAAQAEGDLNALTAQGRMAARVDLGSDAVKALDELVDSLD